VFISSIKASTLKLRGQSGSTVLMMLVLLAGVMMATIAMFANSQVNDSSGTHFMSREKALYISDGTRAFAVQLVQDFLKQNPNATSDDLTQYLKVALPPLLPTGYSLGPDLIVTLVNSQASTIIPNGTFKGMVAPQAQVKFSYTVIYGVDAENRVMHSFDAVVDVAQVGLHQFMYFIDLQSAGFSPGPTTTVNGRIHANGDLCIAGGNGLYLSNVSVAGKLMHSNRAACGVNQTVLPVYPLNKTFISTSTDLNDPFPFGLGNANPNMNDNGCVNCLSSGLNWKDYALSKWNGNAQDIAHLVPKLSLPIPASIQAQVGGNGPSPYIGNSNSTNLRFLVDPVLSADPASVKKLKFAYLSDIRVIDGVWYIRNKNNPDDWPGRPVWSDHPGTFQDAYGKMVGQADLKTALGWASVPKRFSYYDYDFPTHTILGNGLGTVSYGGLFRDTSGGNLKWIPGHILGAYQQVSANGTTVPITVRRGAAWICPRPDPTSALLGTLAGAPIVATAMYSYQTLLNCSPGFGTSPTKATNLLNGTRSGIDDAHVAWYAFNNSYYYPNVLTTPNDRSHILPVNFDVDHFQQALKDAAPGELGSYFTQQGAKTSFNGIVYVTTTWPGSMDGFSPRGAPSPWPTQNDGTWPNNGTWVMVRQGDTSQIPLTSQEAQRSLPYQLCSSATAAGIPQPSQTYDKSPGGFHFVIPDCATYISGGFNAFPNAVRIHNGANIDPAEFPTGLSIVSNMPVYILGSYNTKSLVTSATDTPWIPALIAGDQISILSDAWDDVRDLMTTWNVSKATTRSAATPPLNKSTYNVSLLSGWAMNRPYSTVATNEALHAMPGLLEDWTTESLNFTGSIVIGYYPVYSRGGRYYYDNFIGTGAKSSYIYATYKAGPRNINYDKHLEQISNQPPGSPTFYTSSTQSWKVK
jgi:hypothetical protein